MWSEVGEEGQAAAFNASGLGWAGQVQLILHKAEKNVGWIHMDLENTLELTLWGTPPSEERFRICGHWSFMLRLICRSVCISKREANVQEPQHQGGPQGSHREAEAKLGASKVAQLSLASTTLDKSILTPC